MRKTVLKGIVVGRHPSEDHQSKTYCVGNIKLHQLPLSANATTAYQEESEYSTYSDVPHFAASGRYNPVSTLPYPGRCRQSASFRPYPTTHQNSQNRQTHNTLNHIYPLPYTRHNKAMNRDSRIVIRPARSATDMAAVAVLMTAYVKWLDIDLTFQDFETEMRSLPGKYSPPRGEILLAFDGHGTAIGCVALRPIPDNARCCEMKRLYVIPAGRGTGVGKELIRCILETAGALDYDEMILDSLPRMTRAIDLYKSCGFREIGKYYDTPIPDTIFLGRKISG